MEAELQLKEEIIRKSEGEPRCCTQRQPDFLSYPKTGEKSYFCKIKLFVLRKLFFQLADDYLSLVRVHCYCENMEKAAEIANESGDKVHTLNPNKMFH